MGPAEIIETWLLTEDDAALIAQLAALPAGERRLLLDNVEFFLQREAPVPRSGRGRLLERLGLYGVGRAIKLSARGKSSAGALRKSLAAITGVAELRTLFARRADVLKAAQAHVDIEALALAGVLPPSESDALARAVEGARLGSEDAGARHDVGIRRVAARGTEMPSDLEADLRRVALGNSPAEMLGFAEDASPAAMKAAAAERSSAWRRFEHTAGATEQHRIASLMCQQHAALWQLADGP